MDKVLVDINVINGIISAYRRADQDQSRIYGIILGSKKENIYHITDVIYGFIFETENREKKKKELVKMNEDSLKSLFNSLTQKFKLNNPTATTSKASKENDTTFLANDTLMILGGFVTDKQLYSDLYRLYSTIEKISNEMFYNLNQILLLVDPNHKDENINYGIKAYEWNTKSIKIQGLEKSNALIVFKELKSEVVQKINNMDNISVKNIFEKIHNLKLEKNDKRNINELLLDEKGKEEKVSNSENNIEFIKMKINDTLSYLNLIEQFMENPASDKQFVLNDDDYDKIAYLVSQLEPVLNDKEILDEINSDINKRYNVDSLAQLLEVQVGLSDKIRELIK